MKLRKIDKEAVKNNVEWNKVKKENEKKNENSNTVDIKERYFELNYVDLD